jgi:hypothetical protein
MNTVIQSTGDDDIDVNEYVQENVKNNNARNVNIVEISNIYPTNLVKHVIHASQRAAITRVRAEAYDVCRTEIPHEYIRWAFNKFKNGYVYTIDNKISATCIWKTNEVMNINTLKIKRDIYVYLICGVKLDYQVLPRILDDIVHMCRKEGITHVTLNAVNPHLEQYYIAKGFVHGKNFANSDVLMLDVAKSRISHPETRTAPTQTRRRQRRRRGHAN